MTIASQTLSAQQPTRSIKLTEPYDFGASSFSGWTRRHWEEAFFVLMKGIVASASESAARVRIPGQRSHHGILADEMEGFTRSFIMAGPWLAGNATSQFTHQGTTIDVANFYRSGILAGTDPSHPDYWGDIVDFAQHLVECASLAWSLWLSRDHIWNTFSETEKRQVADYLYQCTRVKYHQNNWLLFNVVTNAVLKRLGMPYSQSQIDTNIKACDSMYLGGGWYRDGAINRIDYYTAWGFHYYYQLWAILDGESNPGCARMHDARACEFVNSFKYFISADGNAPVFGRSMIYRFAYLGPVVLGQYRHALDLQPGEAKTLCNLAMKFFCDREILSHDGHLTLGYLRPNQRMLENYSCGGSPYWACKAFNAFLIPKDDPFWTAQEKPLPIHSGDFQIALKEPGLLLMGSRATGQVQLINQKSYHNQSSYNDKYTKFAYSSTFSYEAGLIGGSFNCDNALQFSRDGEQYSQRWEMTPLYLERAFAASRYPLFGADADGFAITYILAKDDFMINFHRIESAASLDIREGGFPLGFDTGEAAVDVRNGTIAASVNGRFSAIANLHGYAEKKALGPHQESTNVRYRRSVVPVLTARKTAGVPLHLLCLVHGGKENGHPARFDAPVTSACVNGNTARIVFRDGECAFMQIGDISKVTVELNGATLSGEIVCARVSADGKCVSVLEKSGTLTSQQPNL